MTDPLAEELDNIFASIPEPKQAETPVYLTCSTCGYRKGSRSFRKDPSRKRGYEYNCKDCQKKKYASK